MEKEWDDKMKSKQRKREAICFSDMMKMDKMLCYNVAMCRKRARVAYFIYQ